MMMDARLMLNCHLWCSEILKSCFIFTGYSSYKQKTEFHLKFSNLKTQSHKITFTSIFHTFPLPLAGLRLPVYKALACTAPVLPVAPIAAAAVEPKSSDIDVSDLGSRNYGARSDFYCLVTEGDI